MKFPLIKTISWYIIHFIMVSGIATWISGNHKVGFAIASAELIFETILYFGHETIWEKIRKSWN